MKFLRSIIILFLISTRTLFADVRLNNDLIILDSYSGVKFLGEVINDTDSPIKDVKVTITSKDSENKIIDVSYGYVDGYTDPEYRYNDTYIPVGGIVPFMFFGDVSADKIASYSYVINYETTDAAPDDPEQVTILGKINLVEDWLGLKCFGEIANNFSANIYFVEIIFAFKNINGELIDVDYTYIYGEDYLASGFIHTETRISPGGIAPFSLWSSVDQKDLGSYYTIINYKIGEEGAYYYKGSENVVIKGDINKIEYLGDTRYLGEISNNTNLDIYFVSVTIVSRDNNGNIIDISDGYVSGTNYNYYKDYTTDTHIAPGKTAPFDIDTSTNYGDVASFEYLINYRYAETPSSVENDTPLLFTLIENYPNPFNQQTTIEYILKDNTNIELSVYNTAGQKIEVLVDGIVQAGKHSIVWDATGFPSGVYLYILKSNNIIETKKMMLLK